MDNAPMRMWVNQPSTLQPYHEYHGERVLAYYEGYDNTYRVYFLHGETVSMQMPRMALSPGWPL